MLIGLSSCASIPHATVEMSILLGQQIETLENGHIATVDAFYEEKERTVTKWLEEVWYCRYLENLFAQPETIEFWNEVIVEDLPQRIESLKKLTDLIQTDYMEQRDMLLNPLRTEREELLRIIRKHYEFARNMNEAITNNVSSAHAVQEKQKQLLSGIVDTDKIDSQIDRYLQKADSMLNTAQTALEKIDNKLK